VATSDAQLEAAVVDGAHGPVKMAGHILVKHCSKKSVVLWSPWTILAEAKVTGNSPLVALDSDGPDGTTKLAGQLDVGLCAE
jgi:hypothetical protein